MQINLNESDITAGVRMYLESQGINLEGKTLDVLYTAGRGGRGLYAVAEVNGSGGTPAPEYREAPVETGSQEEADLMLASAEESLGAPVTFADEDDVNPFGDDEDVPFS